VGVSFRRCDVTERWRSERFGAAIYDAGNKHDRVATVGAWTMWDAAVGTSILDIPCVASPFGVCVPARPCVTSRRTYLHTCSSERAERRADYRCNPHRDVPSRQFGNAPHAGEIEAWLTEFGLDVVTLEPSGAVEFFDARLPGPAHRMRLARDPVRLCLSR
jgi:hypothetical protein